MEVGSTTEWEEFKTQSSDRLLPHTGRISTHIPGDRWRLNGDLFCSHRATKRQMWLLWAADVSLAHGLKLQLDKHFSELFRKQLDCVWSKATSVEPRDTDTKRIIVWLLRTCRVCTLGGGKGDSHNCTRCSRVSYNSYLETFSLDKLQIYKSAHLEEQVELWISSAALESANESDKPQ